MMVKKLLVAEQNRRLPAGAENLPLVLILVCSLLSMRKLTLTSGLVSNPETFLVVQF